MIDKSDLKYRTGSVISENPRKIIVLTIVITLVLGYFASTMTTSTEEDLFLPDTEKTLYLNEIEDNFGAAEDFIQITTISQDNSFLTTDGMRMFLYLEEEIKQDPSMSPTLVDTDMAEEGVYTPASAILTGIWLLEAEEGLEERLDENMGPIMDYSFTNQTRFYHLMLNSTSACRRLLEEEDQFIVENSTLFLTSKSHVTSKGVEGWLPMQDYAESLEDSGIDFSEALEVLEDENVSNEEKISNLQFVVSDMDSKSEDYPGLEHFADMLRSMKNILILDEEQGHLSQKALTMGVDFFKISTLNIEDPPDISMDIDDESEELDMGKKLDMLSEMDEDDLRDEFSRLMDYEDHELTEQIELATEHNHRMRDEISEADIVVDNLLSEIETAQGLTHEPDQVSGYLSAMEENRTHLSQAEEELQSVLIGLENTGVLPETIQELITVIEMTYKHDENPEIALSLVMVNPPDDMDERIYAHQRAESIASIVTPEGTESRTFSEILMNEEINQTTNRSLEILLPLGFLMVVVLLALIFRTPSEVILSLLSLGMAIIWTLGIGVMLGYSFNPFLIAVPILITGLVIDYGIHMVMRYREERSKGMDPGMASKLTVLSVGGALVLTTLTTTVGFMSNVFIGIDVVQQFGILAAVGIISSLVIMVGFLPSLMRIKDEMQKEENKHEKNNKVTRSERYVIQSTKLSAKKPFATFAVVLLLTSMAMYGVINVDSSFDMMDFLPSESDQRDNIVYLHDNFEVSGSYSYVLIEGDITDSNFLYLVNESTAELEDHDLIASEWGVESPLSVLMSYGSATPLHPDYDEDFVEMYDRADLNNDGIPNNNLTALYDHLYSRSGTERDIERVITDDYSSALIRLPDDAEALSSDLSVAVDLEESVQTAVSVFEDDYSVKVTGHHMISHEATTVLREAQLKSLVITLGIVLSLLSLVFFIKHRSFILGAVTTLPVILVCVWIIGTMYLLGISLNVMTVTITALTVGMGVDYSIHVTHRFNEERTKESDLSKVVGNTISSTGMALLGSATTTIVVFLLLSSSEITPLAQFGLITALAILYSLIVSLYLLPALLSKIYKE
ncbi:MAG: efflux RND transporter permease subunit [Candidatus Saliniplasma sp.]